MNNIYKINYKVFQDHEWANLASVNIFGGFIVTYRMLSMFKSKTPKKKED